MAKYFANTLEIRNLSSSGIKSGSTSSDDDSESNIIQSTIRVDLLAQTAATALASGRAFGGHRPDYAALADEETELFLKIKSLAPHYRVRPSLLGPLASVAFGALGVASSLAPPRLSAAIAAGVSESMTDVFNEQLREMREAGVSESAEDVRLLVRELRDQERAPAGSPGVPDILSLRSPKDISAVEGVAAVFKAGTKLLLDAAKKV
jgi:demethoxyubiquinone hydroxylase (CLK1/Coq7/Cat5 family)